MSIEYYPGDDAKKKKHVVEQLQEPNILYSLGDSFNLTGSPQNIEIWNPGSWEVRRTTLHWTTAVGKDYSITVCRGRGIISGKNNRLFFKADSINEQEILLSQGFYTGAELATELKSKLDANTAFVGVGATPFTVTYAPVTGLFSIAANGGILLQYFYQATALRRLNNYSSAGRALGLTQDQGPLATIVSNVAARNLGVESVYLSGTASANVDVFGTDIIAMSLDNAIEIHLGAVAGTGSYEVIYKILDS